jgi:hypothetical protein
MRARLVVWLPKWVHEQISMQISHSVHRESLMMIMKASCSCGIRERRMVEAAIDSNALMRHYPHLPSSKWNESSFRWLVISFKTIDRLPQETAAS